MKKISILLIIWLSTACTQQVLNTNKKKVAIQGYDPVAYFTEGEACKGDNAITFSYQKVVYHFSSEDNKELFKQSPEKYSPQYGGWCAYAMGKDGTKFSVNPSCFKIFDGKLYLFYKKLGINTLDSWNKDEEKLKTQADENWKRLLKTKIRY